MQQSAYVLVEAETVGGGHVAVLWYWVESLHTNPSNIESDNRRKKKHIYIGRVCASRVQKYGSHKIKCIFI